MGLIEIIVQRDWHRNPPRAAASVLVPFLLPVGALGGVAGLAALAWVSLKVGALSYGGGFVIIPLMQHDAVVTYGWMTNTQFLDAVALGQVTPGPVVLTVAAVGYAAAGLGGALLAALIAFTPSFVFVLAGAKSFNRIRTNRTIQAFLTGAGATVVGAILGSAIPLGLAIAELWQLGVLVLAIIWLPFSEWRPHWSAYPFPISAERCLAREHPILPHQAFLEWSTLTLASTVKLLLLLGEADVISVYPDQSEVHSE
jgi:chromate transporter